MQNLNISGNQSIKTVEVTGNTTLTTLDITNSAVDTVYANGCENLEYLDVSETAITSLNVQDCSNLETLNCASCDINDLNIEGCDSLRNVDCSNNSLRIFDARNFENLRNFECRNQQIHSQTFGSSMNFNDFLRGRGRFAVSAAEVEEAVTYSENVKNLRAYDKAGNEIKVKYDTTTGETAFSTEPSRITYDYETGFEGVKMDVTIYAAEEKPDDSKNLREMGESGIGYMFGFGIEALSAMILLLVPTSRKKSIN